MDHLRRVQRAVLRMHLVTYVMVNASVVAVWALTDEGTFWPALLLIPSSAVLVSHLVASRALTKLLSRHGW